MSIEILYQDAHMLAISKPTDRVVVPGRGELPGEPLAKEIETLLRRKIFVVHRLDRGASGVVLFAKDTETHRHLNIQFEQRLVKKSYWVAVQGKVQSHGRIDQPLHAFGSGRMGVSPTGKPSQTDYTVLEGLEAASLLEVMPTTGRRHQIRVHLYSIGHPVLGDSLYGKERPVGGLPRLMLHALSLDVEGMDGKHVTIRAPLPEDFNAGLRQCGLRIPA